ncbi:MAG: branched-chain amino acid ABC transporter permease [Acetobacteraceae bacterium]|nr:branched-chain amino acid ABC transporter permease [Acetobacteraceae bacterium]
MEQALLYAATLGTLAGIYAVLALGLNLQWGLTGLMNFGGLGFVAVGAYTAALLTAAPSPTHVGGFGVPWWLAWPAAAATAALLALPIGAIALRLRTDYLAIATIGIAEIVRLIARNEDWLTGGPLGVTAIPRPLESLGTPMGQVAFLLLVGGILAHPVCGRAGDREEPVRAGAARGARRRGGGQGGGQEPRATCACTPSCSAPRSWVSGGR